MATNRRRESKGIALTGPRARLLELDIKRRADAYERRQAAAGRPVPPQPASNRPAWVSTLIWAETMKRCHLRTGLGLAQLVEAHAAATEAVLSRLGPIEPPPSDGQQPSPNHRDDAETA